MVSWSKRAGKTVSHQDEGGRGALEWLWLLGSFSSSPVVVIRKPLQQPSCQLPCLQYPGSLSLPFGGFLTCWSGCPRDARPVVPSQKANVSHNAFSSRGCVLRTPQGCWFGQCTGFHGHRWLMVVASPR